MTSYWRCVTWRNSIKNLASEIEGSLWYFCKDHELD